MAVEDKLAAYLLDRAVALFGTCVERDIEDATEGKKKRAAIAASEMVLSKWIVTKGAKRQFRQPVATA